MADIGGALKAEIQRISRKEFRPDLDALKAAVRRLRADLSNLKRRAADAERSMRRIGNGPAGEAKATRPSSKFRFSAKGLAAHRRRLGLTARQCAALLGATAQSVYNWEDGSARPREKHLAAIAELRTLGKKAAQERLSSLA